MVDLHTHTTASDGSLSPSELVKKAEKLGLTAIGITDHDTINGVGEALEAGKYLNIEVVAGVELGVDYDGMEIHILGYFSPENYMKMNGYFDWILEKRHERNRMLILNLNKAGYNVTVEEMYEKAAGGTPGRPHLAKCLIEKGYAADVNEVFEKILLREDIYIPREKTKPESAVGEILKNKGIPVLAHPVYMEKDGLFESSLEHFMEIGIKGIEAFHSDQDEHDARKYIETANRHGLIVTGGSDFHGANKDNAFLGSPPVDDRYYYRLLEQL